MGWHFHKWTKWGDLFRRDIHYTDVEVGEKGVRKTVWMQERSCTVCNKIQQRRLRSIS